MLKNNKYLSNRDSDLGESALKILDSECLYTFNTLSPFFCRSSFEVALSVFFPDLLSDLQLLVTNSMYFSLDALKAFFVEDFLLWPWCNQ